MIIVASCDVLDVNTGDMIACVERTHKGALNLWDINGDVNVWTHIPSGESFWNSLSKWVAEKLDKDEEEFYFVDSSEPYILW